MQQLNSTINHAATWQNELADLISCPKELWQLLARTHELNAMHQAHQLFPIRLPRSYWHRLQQLADPAPILKQFLPDQEELLEIPGYTTDPLQEAAANQIPGLLHKYSSRVLLTVTKSCAVHCRYCFRRHFNYQDNNPGKAGWRQAMAYIKQHQEIQEVIFSGGDPLAVTDAYLEFMVDELKQIDHITTLRLHTRLPAIIPKRITDQLLQVFAKSGKQLVLVIHINHPLEIDATVAAAMQRLRANGWLLLNQSVLLAGVNDSLPTLKDLSNKLFQAGVLPYYLHLPDKVQGTHHFDVERQHALTLYQQLQGALPGYLVPLLVTEIAHEQSKTRL